MYDFCSDPDSDELRCPDLSRSSEFAKSRCVTPNGTSTVPAISPPQHITVQNMVQEASHQRLHMVLALRAEVRTLVCLH